MSILTCKEVFGFVSLFLPVLGISGYGRSNEEKKNKAMQGNDDPRRRRCVGPPIPSLAIGHGHGHGGESPEIPASFPKTTSLGAVS